MQTAAVPVAKASLSLWIRVFGRPTFAAMLGQCELFAYFKMLSGLLICLICLCCLRTDGYSSSAFEGNIAASTKLSSFHRMLSELDRSGLTCPAVHNHSCAFSDVVELRVGDGKVPQRVANASARVLSAIQGTEDLLPVQPSDIPQSLPLWDDIDASSQPPIATFDEWTKEKLKQDFLKKAKHQGMHQPTGSSTAKEGQKVEPKSTHREEFHPAGTPPVILQEAAQRNYASRECGAKVLFSNEEAENKNAVLNEKERDDYMRNPCERAKHKWLIIELCETVQPVAIELANFELFSSGPREVSVSGSERSSDGWTLLGEFVAENTRNIQRFSFGDIRVYVKFIRLELLSHHGNEHYCTLSLLRFLGISMVDEYEAEAEAAATPIESTKEGDASSQLRANLATTTTTATAPPRAGGGAQTTCVGPACEQLNTATPKPDNASPKTDPLMSGTLKPKDRRIVDAVVSAVGTIGIGNIKNVIESALLGNWKSDRSISPSCSSVLWLPWACWSCAASDLVRVPSPQFCRAFFPSRRARPIDLPLKDNLPNATYAYASNNSSSLPTTIRSSKGPSAVKQRSGFAKNGQREFLLAIAAGSRGVCLPAEGSHIVESTAPFTDEASESANSVADSSSTNSASLPSDSVIAAQLKNEGAQSLPGATVSPKESVFLKLNKRIAALELNISLSSEYLSELSRRYVEQSSEGRRHMENTLRLAEEAAARAARTVQQTLSKQVSDIAHEVKELERMLRAVSSRTVHFESSFKKPTAMVVDVPSGEGTPVDEGTGAGESVVPHAQPHILYSNDHIWTSEQLVCMVILAQACTAVLMLLAECCYRRNAVIDKRDVERIVDEKIKKLSLTESVSAPSEVTVSLEVAKNKPKRRRKHGKRKEPQPPDWDSAVEWSVASTGRTVSELSSEVEAENRLGAAANIVDDCAAVLCRLEWSAVQAEAVSSNLVAALPPSESLEIPSLSSHLHPVDDKTPLASRLRLDLPQLAEQQQVSPNGLWQVAKPTKRRNKRKIVF